MQLSKLPAKQVMLNLVVVKVVEMMVNAPLPFVFATPIFTLSPGIPVRLIMNEDEELKREENL